MGLYQTIKTTGSNRRKNYYKDQYGSPRHRHKVKDYFIRKTNYTCQFCGYKAKYSGQLRIHHSTYEFLGDEFSHPSSVIVLCKKCHKGIHRNFR